MSEPITFTVRHDYGPRLTDPRAVTAYFHERQEMAEALARARRAAQQLNIAFEYVVAAGAYRNLVGKLPGSNRTVRLRKKRRKAVLSWYQKHFKGKRP